MLVEITVENLAIIEHTQLKLGPGLTVLTGETGAGKSLLIDAIELALGDRADTDLVRAGAPRATVNVVLDLTSHPELLQRCESLGISIEDGLLYIAREVFAEGRSQCRVGGKLTPVSALKQLGQFLVDLHGQHDHQSLLHQERHIDFLDSWIGAPAKELLGRVNELHEQAQHAKARLSALRAGLRDREQRIDLLSYQVHEIEAVSPDPGEYPLLEQQLSRLKNSEKLSFAASSAMAAISDGEDCAFDQLSSAVRTLEDAMKLDSSLEDVVDLLRNSLYTLEDGVRSVRHYAESVQSDPETLEATAERLDALKRLRRKYGEDEAAIIVFLQKAKAELEVISDGGNSEADLQAASDAAEAQLQRAAAELTELRRERAVDFSKLAEAQLRELAMERAIFTTRIEPKPIDSTGADRVEFFFSANAGEPPRPLAKIASGGEISRVMLAIKSAMAGRAGVPTLIFDEVDAGLGGRAAVVVSKKLEELAQHYQVLVISHLPQIASRALSHYRIEKNESSGRVRTDVRALSPDERIEEIARMLAGDNLSESARSTAVEMLSGGR